MTIAAAIGPQAAGERAGQVLRWGVVVFPGTNCDEDTLHVLKSVVGQGARPVWHADTDLSDLDALVLPGHLRTATICGRAPWPGSAR